MLTGWSPFRWQKRLFERLAVGDVPPGSARSRPVCPSRIPAARRILALALPTPGKPERLGELAAMVEDGQALGEVAPERHARHRADGLRRRALRLRVLPRRARLREFLRLGAGGGEQPEVEALAAEDAALPRYYPRVGR